MGALVHLAEQREIQAEADFVFLLEWMKLGGWLMVLEWVCNGCNYKLIFRTIFSTLFSYLVKRFILKSILSESHVDSFVLFYIQHASNWQLGNVATLICRNWSFISGCYFCLLKNSTQQNCWFTTDSGWNFDFPQGFPMHASFKKTFSRSSFRFHWYLSFFWPLKARCVLRDYTKILLIWCCHVEVFVFYYSNCKSI